MEFQNVVDNQSYNMYQKLLIWAMQIFDTLAQMLFVVFRPTQIFFTHMNTSPVREGLQIFIYALHSWPSSIKGSLVCHTFRGTGLPFIMVISMDQWHSHLCSSVFTIFLMNRSWDSKTQHSAGAHTIATVISQKLIERL